MKTWTVVNQCSASPSLETLQSLVDVSLVELCHVGVHFRIVVSNVPLCAAVRDGPEAERRREVVRTLELKVATLTVKSLYSKRRWRKGKEESKGNF